MTAQPLRGVALVLGAAMLWGSTGTAQSLASPQLSSVWVGALRLAGAALFFALLRAGSAARGHQDGTQALPWPGIAAAAACMAVYNLAFFAGVRALGVAVGTALALGSGPLWAGLLQALAWRRPPSPAWWLGTMLAVGGGVALVSDGGAAAPGSASGLMLCLAAGLSYAVYALLNKGLVARAAPGRVTGAVFMLAAALSLPAAFVMAELPSLGARDVLVVGWLGVVATGMAYLLFSHGLRHVSGATGVSLALFEPVTAFVLALLVVGERPGLLAFAGLLAVLAGLAVVIRTEVR
jgi:DME family drug/metabolite transporter